MTPERFRELAWAYGGDIGRWPQETRVAAGELAEGAAELQTVLADAGALDAALGDYRVTAPDGAMLRAIAVGAPRRPLWRRAVIWWLGLAFAAAAAAGGITGALVLTDPGLAPAAPSMADMAYDATVFGDLAS